MDVTQLNRHAGPIPQRQVISGVISTSQPAPTGLDQQVYVIAPDYSIDRPLGPCKFAAVHGQRLPARGAECLVVFDDQGVPVVVWWDGLFTAGSATPSGPASGDLSGSYPNPGVAQIQGQPVAPTPPSSNQGLVWNGTKWAPATVLQAANNLSDITSVISARQNLGIRVGTGVWTWPGGQTASGTLVVPHGLGRVPTVVDAFPITGPQGNALSGIAYGYDATNFITEGIFASFSPGAGGTVNFGWIAIG